MRISILILVLAISTYAQHMEDDVDGEYNMFGDSYREDLAVRLFYLTSASYCNQKYITSWTCGTPCKKTSSIQDITIFVNSTNENAGYAGYDKLTNEIVVVFRGTEPYSIKNWMEDIDFIKTPYPYCPNNCQVHRGFYYSYQGIETQVYNSVRQLKSKYPQAGIIITGHSLGGALATHALVHLMNKGYVIRDFYTFGSPRVGDQAFFQWVSQTLYPSPKYRITHDHDPVPHLPMMAQGFHHINTEAYYKDILIIFRKNVKICNDSVKEDPKCSNSNLLDLDAIDHCNYMGYNMAVDWALCQ